MDNLSRRIFFWTLVVLFFLTAPAIVLYARGFRFDSHRGVFVHSGAINIKSNPQTMDVTINNEISQSKKLNRINNSYNISGLIPGDYQIKLSADGFQSWNKTMDVHSGLAAEFWNVLLVRSNYERTAFDTPGIETFYASPKNDYIAYTEKSDNNLTLNAFNLSAKKNDAVFSFPGWQFIETERKENVEWSPEEDYLSIPVKHEVAIAPEKNSRKTGLNQNSTETTQTEYAYFIANLSDQTSFSLNDFLGRKNIKDVRWDPKNKNYLFFMDGTDFYRANILDKTDLTLIAPDVSSYDISRSYVYYVQNPNNLVFRNNLDGHADPAQVTSSFPQENASIKRLTVYDDDRIAFLAQDKSLFIYNVGDRDTYFKKLADNAEGSHFSDDGKKMLFWTTNEISAYFVRDWLVQPVRSENDLTNITRYSETIRNVQWFKDYEHIIFTTGRFAKIIELDGRDHRNSMDLVSTALESPFMIYDGFLEKLFFTDSVNGKNTLNSIVFPEPIPFLGIGG